MDTVTLPSFDNTTGMPEGLHLSTGRNNLFRCYPFYVRWLYFSVRSGTERTGAADESIVLEAIQSHSGAVENRFILSPPHEDDLFVGSGEAMHEDVSTIEPNQL